METVAFIPVRGGSKSIPKKNVRLLAGRPLVHWVTQTALDCESVNRVYVSSDSLEIRQVAARLASPKLHVIERSSELATDTASTEAALLEFAERHTFGRVVLIQATSPLTRVEDLDGALEKMRLLGCDSLVSVTRERRFRWREIEPGVVSPDNYDPAQRPRRQDWAGELIENGAFYTTTREALLSSRCRVSGRISYWEMPPETALELDAAADWRLMEAILARKTERIEPSKADRIKLIVTDVDGVLTDAGMYYSADGDQLKKFNTRDGMGVALWRKRGLSVAVVTGESHRAVEQRAKKLGIESVVLGATDKLAVVEQLAQDHQTALDEIAYIGDDINDLQAMSRVGFTACPADASPEVRATVDMVCERSGGGGCFRELVDYLTSAKRPEG